MLSHSDIATHRQKLTTLPPQTAPVPTTSAPKFESSWDQVQALQNQQNLDSSDQPKDSIVQKNSGTASLLAKATPLIGPIPTVVIKFVEHFKQEKTKTIDTLSSVSPGLLLAPQGLNKQSLSLLPVDFSAVERTLVENPNNPHYAIEELGRQLTNSTEFSEKTKQWVQTTCFELNQFVHQYASEMGANPIQGKMETVAGVFHGLGSCGKDLVNMQAYISLGPFYSIEEIQGALHKVDSVCSTVGNHYTQTIQAVNPQFNPESAAFQTGHFVGKYVLPLLGPGVVKKVPSPKVPRLTEKAAELVNKLESRLAQNTERLFAKNPMPATGSSSLKSAAFTEEIPAAISRSNAKKPISKTSQTATKTEASTTKPVRELRKPEDVYAPDRRLPLDKCGNKVPDTDAPHTQLETREGRKATYTQAREYDAQGHPVRDIDFTDHGRPLEHPNPHQHNYTKNATGGTLTRDKKTKKVDEWNYD